MKFVLIVAILVFHITSMLAFKLRGLQRGGLLFRPHFQVALFGDRTGREESSEFRARSNNRFSSSDRDRGENSRSSFRENGSHRGERRLPPVKFNDRQYNDRYPAHQPRDYYRKEEKTEPAWGYYDGDHLFGISPVSMALRSSRRTIKELLVQEGMDLSNKKDKKAAADILKIAKEKNISIREFSKHDLNMITDNKLHQGFVLRAEPLEFVPLTHMEPSDKFSCVLALDEVWDPMNFGALVRTSHFLGVDKIVICAKNSAPLSPTVSKASAGAVEVMTIYSTNNLMNFLDKSVANGWQVVGTALTPEATPLKEFSVNNKPTILVLGNEGHGMRTNIVRRCTSLVRISKPIATESDDGDETGEGGGVEVDSLNVSVTGGIILNHLLQSRK